MDTNLDRIEKYKKKDFLRAFKGGHDAVIRVYGCGIMLVKLKIGEKPIVRRHYFLYVPDLVKTLLSVPSMSTDFVQWKAVNIYEREQTCRKADNKLEGLSIEIAMSETSQIAPLKKSVKLRNGRSGHGNVQSMKKTASSEAVLGLEAVQYQKFHCESCAMQKNTIHRSSKSVTQSTGLFQVVRSDEYGSMNIVL